MASKYYFDIEQGSEDWFKIRKGKLTGSHAQAIGNQGKGLDTYIKKICSEFYSSGEKEHYSNKHIERGHELEPQARELYELENMCEVAQVGFIEYNEYIGTSPDGLFGDDGCIEIKSQDDEKHFSLVLNGEKEIDSGYRWQMQFNIWVADRKWCDFISYNPNYKKALVVIRVYRDDAMIKEIQDGCLLGISKIKEMKKLYESKIS